MTQRQSGEPFPIDPGAPRHAPARGLPAHRYLPGENDRPPDAGHALAAPIVWERLFEVELYRFGVDLYNGAYFWEAHEAWETLWQACPEGPVREGLQGLIQLAAALLKEHQGVVSGATRLARSALAKLERAPEGTFGFSASQLIAKARAHFRPLEEPGSPRVSPPGIRLG